MSIISTMTQLPNDDLFMLLCKSRDEAKVLSTQYSASWFWQLRNRDAGYLFVPNLEHMEKKNKRTQ